MITKTPTRNQPHIKEDGFVLLTALVVIFLVISIVASVMLITSSDMQSNANARKVSSSRLSAESVLDTIFAYLSRETTDFFDKANNIDYIKDTNPKFTDVPNITHFTNWLTIKDGSIAPCSDITDTCFILKIGRPGYISTILYVTIVVRFGCKTDKTGCKWNEFSQRLDARTYTQNVMTIGTANNSVSSKPVAFLQGDYIEGPISSNGVIYRCKQVSLNSMNAKSAVDTVVQKINIPSCNSGTNTVTKQEAQFLPGQIDNTADVNPAKVFKDIAGDYNFEGGTSIRLDKDGITVNDSSGTRSLAYPSNGVIYVRGDLKISGQYSKSLSIFAENNITVTDNITYINFSGSTEFDGYSGAAPDNTLLGLAAGRDIELQCNQESSGRCKPLNIVGVLNARNGKIMNTRWNNSPVGPVLPEVTIYGSIISQVQPIFGSYRASSNGKLTDGWSKRLRYDSRLATIQPPYFFRTTQSSIIRSIINQGICFNSMCGDTDTWNGP